MRMHSFLRHRIYIVVAAVCVAGFGPFGPAAYAGVYFMTDSGEQRGSLDVSDAGLNKGKVVVVGTDGKEIVLGGGSCGTLCALLTAKIEDGKAQIVPAVPDIDLGTPASRLKTIFAGTINANTLMFPMTNPEFATAAVGKMLGIVSTDGANAIVGVVDTKDERTDVLVTDMAQAKKDIEDLKAQLASVQVALAMKVKETLACRSDVIPAVITKAIGSGD